MSLFKRLIRQPAVAAPESPIAPIPYGLIDPLERARYTTTQTFNGAPAEQYHGHMKNPQMATPPRVMQSNAPEIYPEVTYHRTRPGTNVNSIESMIPAGEID